MRRLIVNGTFVLLLFSVLPIHPGIVTQFRSLETDNINSHSAPPLEDTFPSLVPPPVSIARSPSYALGRMSLLVICVEFSNVQHTKTIEEINRLIFTDVNAYFQEVSYGKVSLSGKVVGWYNMNKTVGAYGRDGLTVDDPSVDGSVDSWLLIQDAINVAGRDVVDFSQYGYVMTLHAGFGQETSQDPNDLWSCAYLWGIWFTTKDRHAFSHATIVPEIEDKGVVAFGVICHEFGHELGLPDLYDSYGHEDYVGKFDLMGKGIYNGIPAASSPAHPLSWCKISLDWINSDQINTVEKGARMNATVNAVEKAGKLLVVKVPIDTGQYYLVEVRQRIGFDFALPTTGVLISYVDERYSGGGKVRLVDANPLTATLDDAPYQVGQTFRDAENQIAVSILYSSNQDYQVYIDRGSPKPDLAILFSAMDPQRARTGQIVTFTFLLSNQGNLVARDFRVNILVDGLTVGVETYSLEAGSNRMIQFRWNATLGAHRLDVKVDPNNLLDELNRMNNQLTHEFMVGSMLSIRLPWDNGAVKVNGISYLSNSSTVDILVLPGIQRIEVPAGRVVSAGKRLTFVRWNDGETSNPRSYNATGDTILVTVYKTEYKLAIQGNKGEVTGEGWYNEDATAVAEARSPTMLTAGKTRLTFQRWTGDVESNRTSIDLKMDRPKNITAVWNCEHYLTVVTSFSSTEKQGWYREGERVTVSANPILDHGNGTRRVFLNWSGSISSNSPQVEVIMTAPHTIVAGYRTEYEFIITSERGSIGAKKWVPAGETIKIAAPREITEGETRYLFMKWEGAIQTDSSEATITVEAPKSVTAVWRAQHRLTFEVSGVPNGTSVIVKINGQDNQGSAPYRYSEWFNAGSSVTFETAVTIETATHKYSLEGWKNSAGEWVKSPFVLNSPTALRTVYASRPKSLLDRLTSALGAPTAQVAIYWTCIKQSQVGTFTAGVGKTFVVVTATIMNRGYSDFATNPHFFYLDTDLEIHGVNDATSQLSDRLPEAILPSGAQVTGRLAFLVAQSEGSFSLRYSRQPRTYDIRYNQQGRCIIATAAYGSDLEPEVQILRDFRDRTLLSSFVGSQFMVVFDAFYYSFSPQVAQIVASNSLIAHMTRIMLVPLITILRTLTVMPGTEIGVISYGAEAAALIGMTYLTLPMILLESFTRCKCGRKKSCARQTTSS